MLCFSSPPHPGSIRLSAHVKARERQVGGVDGKGGALLTVCPDSHRPLTDVDALMHHLARTKQVKKDEKASSFATWEAEFFFIKSPPIV